jgi:hypothetical protein
MKRKVVMALLAIVMRIQGAHAQSSVGNFFTGDAKVEAVEHGGEAQIVPKPERVVIHDFTVRTDDIALDHSVAGRLHRDRLWRHGTDEDSTPEVLAQHVQVAFYKALIDQLEKDHITAARAANGGSESKRVMIGFGSGASELKTHVTLSSVVAGRSTVVLTFDLDSKSGKSPGALPGMVAGSLVVGVATTTVGDKKATLDADASRLAELVAKQIESLMSDRPGLAAPAAETARTAPVGRAAG